MALETERLLLRDWGEADIAPFIRHTNTPAVMRWLGGVQRGAALADAIRGRMMRWQKERGFTFWVVERKADAALLGFCGIKIADTEGSPIEGVHEAAGVCARTPGGRAMPGRRPSPRSITPSRRSARRASSPSPFRETGPAGG